MPTTTLTSKGRVTIPVDVRKRLGLQAGDRIAFYLNAASGRYEVVPAKPSVTDPKGILCKPTEAISGVCR
ncbi:AbrB/MazE/SpoVT family DNA-binding domain-containing protein [Bordetella genomosp. 5]|uniref:AbrB family transcriptional regulator n=1 Tax=Bordetella genomosp. 5 TaxID=1395608 RepID=A0A261TWN0_9BORD|nr:AbrB/MazE/SpoVT family DNA-binding domain-containing protein [Bordetella genomosp. 5]OZI53701.1 AbrB family transcriptional regulator [Bordetella genomosp. 5]